MNQGGRLKFVADSEVRVLLQDGTISRDIYKISPKEDLDNIQADNKGIISVLNTTTNKEIRINQRRILPVSIDGCAIVLESGEHYKAICPSCSNIIEVTPNDVKIICSCAGEFKLHWYSTKPIATSIIERKNKPKKSNEGKVKVDKQPKTIVEPIIVNFDELKSLSSCEVYTKKNVKFDHPEFDVKAHTILYTGNSPRKLCFNTYNGALGKKQSALPLKEFVDDSPVIGSKREKPWFVLKDLEVARKKLLDEGFERL